ncbi:MAG TPA: diphosphate--fructose-6-phosphate 1-phosphotransferase [Dongiaceae bacterium]|nr:diphosphate--fructose-6-phosphate 1-phosphotransferase [Dongiaceae bacterium]
MREAALDVASMCATSTKIFIMEVMGRHAGWIAAAGALAREEAGDPPHIIVFPEIKFDRAAFLAKVKTSVQNHGYCVIVISEGAQNPDGTFLSDSGAKDAFGHTQLGGVAPFVANLIKSELGYKYHWAVADYLQRAARHIASATDVEQAYAVGKAAVDFAMAGKNAVMATIVRNPGPVYSWSIGEAPLAQVANVEQKMPRHFISDDGFDVTAPGLEYLRPLIQGESYPPYKNGIPEIAHLKKVKVEKILNTPFSLK